VRKTYLAILLAAVAVLAVSCGKQEQKTEGQITARPHVQDQRVAECDSALNAYMAEHPTDYSFDDIETIMDSCGDLDPSNTELMRYIQDNYFGFDKADELTDIYSALYSRDSNSASTTYLYGRILTDRDEQMRLFKRATTLDSNYYWGWYALGVTVVDEPYSDTAEAISSLMKAVSIDNSQSAPFRELGAIYQAKGDTAKALQFYDLLSQTDPDNMRSLSPMISLLKKGGNYEDAQKAILKWDQDHTDDYDAENEWADLYIDQGKYDEAIPHLTRMVDLARNPNNAYYKLITTYCKMDQPDKAYAVLEDAMSKGYSDYRLIMHDPALAKLRSYSDFAEMKTTIVAAQDSARLAMQAERSKDRETRKKEVFEELIDRKAPDFTLTDLQGNLVTLSELKGNVVILDFWATWCGPCRMTMPLLQTFHDAHDDEMKYYAVNVWEADTSLVRPFLKKYGYTFNSLFGSAQTASDFGVKGIPTLFVIGKDGNIKFEQSGYRPDMDEVLSWLLVKFSK
jgi:pentatricopeptide repeat protein